MRGLHLQRVKLQTVGRLPNEVALFADEPWHIYEFHANPTPTQEYKDYESCMPKRSLAKR